MVVYPHMMAPFVVGRRPSVVALERALGRPDKQIFLATQRDPKVDQPTEDDIHRLGVVARVVQHLQLASGNIKVMVEGLSRARLIDIEDDDGCLMARVERIQAQAPQDESVSSYMTQLVELFKEYAKLSHHLSAEGVLASLQTEDPDQFADILAAQDGEIHPAVFQDSETQGMTAIAERQRQIQLAQRIQQAPLGPLDARP